MKKLVSYSNCQGAGLIYFLKKSKMAEHYTFSHYNNYQLILKEQNAEDLFRESAMADIFLYQPTPAIQYCERSTESMIAEIVPKDSMKVSFGYGYNDGVFPVCHHGSWRTGREVLRLAKEDRKLMFKKYDDGTLNFDCALRFIKCAREQLRRELSDDIKMADFVLSHFQKEQLFLCENHPCSAYFAELAFRLIKHTHPGWEDKIPYSTNNDANLPCGMAVHQGVVDELELEFKCEPNAHGYFRGFLERLT